MTKLDTGHLIKTLVSSELLAAIDEWRSHQPAPPNRSEVVRRAIFAFIESRTWRRGGDVKPWGDTAAEHSGSRDGEERS